MTHGLTGRARRPAPAGSFAAVDDAMLRNTAALVAWRTANLKTEPCGPDLVFVLGAAERALEKATKSAAAMFVVLVRDRREDLISGAQEDRARQRLRQYWNSKQ